MEERTAYALGSQWAQAHRGREAQQAHTCTHLVVGALRIIPGETQWAVEPDEAPLRRLLLLNKQSLWRLTVLPHEAEESGAAEVRTEYTTLSPETCELTVDQQWGTRSDGVVQQAGWLRRYRLQVSRGGSASFELCVDGRELLQGGWSGDSGLDREEIFGRALAAVLGWEAGGER